MINGALLALLVLTLPRSTAPLREEALWVSLETAAEAQTEGMAAEPPAPSMPPAAPQRIVAPNPPTPAMTEAPAVPQQAPAHAPVQTTTTDSKASNPTQPAADPGAMSAASRPATSTGSARTQTAIASGDSKHAAASYAARVRAHIESFKVYPPQARRRHQTGLVSFIFTVDRQGRVLSAHVTKSSGNPALDQAALDMLNAAQPLPKPPSDLPGDTLGMTSLAEFGLTK